MNIQQTMYSLIIGNGRMDGRTYSPLKARKENPKVAILLIQEIVTEF